ncbi:MAG TPA: hypothetical protein VF591_07120 [Pyrinomonadaceae bacterium]|jgi:hypothetical protein
MMRQNLVSTIFLLSMSVTAAARQTVVEYGHAGELKGVKRVYVSTDLDMKARESIVKELLKRLPGLEITRTPEAADVHVVYRGERLHVPGALSWVGESEPAYLESARHLYAGLRNAAVATQLLPVAVGTGTVLKNVGPGRSRLLMSYRGESLAGSFERSPSTNFVRAFVKEYKRANAPGAGAR